MNERHDIGFGGQKAELNEKDFEFGGQKAKLNERGDLAFGGEKAVEARDKAFGGEDEKRSPILHIKPTKRCDMGFGGEDDHC